MMADNWQKFLDELRSRISIAEVIGEKVKLTKRGREYLGLCPFHREKTPSFTINESKGFYHCFGCGAHGDVIKYLVDSEGLPFIEAVKKLAARVNMQLPELSSANREEIQKRKSFYEIMDIAADYFTKNLYLPVGAEGLKYLKQKRGLSDEVIKKFRMGYAPSNNGLKALLSSKGISERDMADLGLINISDDQNKTAHDFFWNRVMIPIFDKQNNVIAFGGRILGDGQPKYLNSPETPIFNKRRILYNLNQARDSAYAQKRLIICEGYMDVIALSSFNFPYAVAPLGTALTEEQIIEAWKVCNVPTLCFDGDSAGIKAAIRSIDRILPNLRPGYSANYIFLKEKKDPDELLRTLGPLVFEQYMQKAKPLVDILWHRCKMNKKTDTPEQKALIEKETMEAVAKIKDSQTRAYYAQEMKKRIYYAFGKGAIYRDDDQANRRTAVRSRAKTNYNFVHKPPLNDLFLRKITAALIMYPQLIGKYDEKLTCFELKNSLISRLLSEIMEIKREDDHIDSDTLLEKLKLNHKDIVNGLWEFKMYKEQNIDLRDLQTEIDSSLREFQIKQIDKEMKECATLMKSQSGDNEKLNLRYKQLAAEREHLFAETEDWAKTY